LSSALWFGVAAATVAAVVIIAALPELPLSHEVGEQRLRSEAEGASPVAA
jgi:hypothetical protein